MKARSHIRSALFLVASLAIIPPVRLSAQATGSVEFTARVAPAGGRPEPVRQLTFCLLRKSLADIRAEAQQAAPAPDLDQFIGGLSVSPELKTWMKKHRSVEFAGQDFVKSLSPDDIVDVPEFFDAFMKRNMGYKGVGVPTPKFKEKDRASNPEKYEQAKEEYKGSIRKLIAAVPETVQGIDADLADLDPSKKWESLARRQSTLRDSRTIELAENRYLAAQTDTDLDGRGSFSGLAPGHYWIALLGAEAISGDVRLRWDFPVTVRGGETTRAELSNVNAMKSGVAASISNP